MVSSSRRISVLHVLMNGRLVGWLRNSARGVLSFEYDPSWLNFEGRRPISLSLPLSQIEYADLAVENYFDNLLPDSQPIRSRLQARIGAESGRCFDLLARIGRDCAGALQLLPEGEKVDIRKVHAQPLTDQEIGVILTNYQSMSLGVDLDADFRISLTGAQEKTALLYHAGQWCRPAGATPTSHIFKLPIGELGRTGIDLSTSIENEWLCRQILATFDLPVASVEIKTFGDQKVLIVERFDRRWSEDGSWLIRLPQEDMCQATGTSGHLKYETDGGPGMQRIMDILLGSVQSQEDRRTFMKAQLVFWMLAAIDGHAKNFSIFHLPGGLYRLTPFYDVISVHPLMANRQIDRQRVAMTMAVSGKNRHYRWDMITRRHWLENAWKCRFSSEEMDLIIDECCDRLAVVIEHVTQLLPQGFPEEIASSIFSGLEGAKNRLGSSGCNL
jgi:serine/threonine-protein kinase HipA